LVSAELDTNRIQQTSETFDPESKVTRSTQNRNEASTTTETTDGSVSVANQLPSGQSSNGAQKDAQNKSEEIVNYEISKTTRTEMTDAGRLKKLSIAVVIDGIYQKDANGNLTYQPRAQDEINKIIALIKSGIGFDAKRGDQIEVSNLKFTETSETDTPAEPKSWYNFGNFDLNRLIELAVLSLLSLIIALFVGRPLVKALGKQEQATLPAPDGQSTQAIAANPIDNVTALISARPEASLATIKQWIREPSGT
jgi:flagellar M-ring protein FliF